ncbi:NrsF family protein [Novosphingobium terrae]|uniref:NrsF family protein n=1 Tax=Novosphingobium terrae TaxID=2726189 RepID=UPI00197DC4D7|nr:DUF1109 domain-containing protein [Novosphingobium terrae]
MLSDALILDLSANLAPVRRRRPSREIALLLALGGGELALLLGLGLMRPDMGRMIATPYMLWKLCGLALLAGAACIGAIRSFAPTVRPRAGLMVVFALAVAMMIAGAFVTPGHYGGQTWLDRLAPLQGMLCSTSIVVLSLPLMAMLSVLMHRGAPTHPQGSALASGLAAITLGAFIFAFCCRVNDPLYIAVWYSVACAVVTSMARWLLPRRFRL